MSYVIVALVFTVIGVVLGARYSECISDFYEMLRN